MVQIFFQTNDSTALHLAAAGGHKEVVLVLLEAGASAIDENAVSRLFLVQTCDFTDCKLFTLFKCYVF